MSLYIYINKYTQYTFILYSVLHGNIAEITAQELPLSSVYYLISSDNGSIKLSIRIFVQTSFLEGRAGYVFLKGCVSVTISYLSC